MMNIIQSAKKRKFELFLLALYLLSFGISLFSRSYYWDDWVWVSRDFSFFHDLATQMGLLWSPYLNFLTFNHVSAARLFVLVFNFGTALFFYNILKIHINKPNAFWLSVLFILLPVNGIRPVLSVFQYSFCLFLFMGGFYLLAVNFQNRGWILRVLTYFLFFLSFDMNSLVFFYLIPALYVWWRYNRFKDFSVFKLYFDYILVLVVYLFIKLVFLQPQGAYAGYNSIDFSGIIQSPVFLGISFYKLLIEGSYQVLKTGISSPLILVFYIPVYLLIRKIDTSGIRFVRLHLILGLGLLFWGLLPYILVGKIPSLGDWESRHSVLCGFGMSFILFSVISGFLQGLNKKVVHLLLAYLLTSLVIFNLFYSNSLLTAGYKIDSIVENMRGSDIIEDNTGFIFMDESHDDNAVFTQKIDRFYTLNGMMYEAFGDETRYMAQDFATYKQFMNMGQKEPFLRYRDWVPKDPEYIVYLKNGGETGLAKQIKLMIFSLLSPARYTEEVASLYILEYEKIDK